MTDLTVRAAVLRVLKDTITRAELAAKADLAADMKAGERKVAYLGNVEVGVINHTRPSESWQVVDDAAYLAWVRANRPDEIVTVEQVRPAFTRALDDVITRTGEVPDGVILTQTPGHVRVTVTQDHKAAMRASLGEVLTDHGRHLLLEP